jgi:hypothetical protein
MDMSEFARNRCLHSPEELAPYQEKHVAWSTDGKQILASAETWEELYREIDRKGITDYVIGFIPSGDISDLGGGLL